MRRAFRAQGFVVVPGVFAPPEMCSLAALVEQVVGDQEQELRRQDAATLTTPGRHGGGAGSVEGVGLRSTVEVGADGSLAWELQRPTRYYRGLQASPGQHCH